MTKTGFIHWFYLPILINELFLLQLDTIFYDKTSSQLKIDIFSSGWMLNAKSGRAKYSGNGSMYSAPEVKTQSSHVVTQTDQEELLHFEKSLWLSQMK